MYTDKLGIEPGEVIQPTTVEAVCAAVTRAAQTGKSIIPWGGGTGQTYGYRPRSADILLDVSRFSRIVAHEYADLTVTVEAGATLAEVQATLGRYNQFLPLDAPFPQNATIGGILACNAFGPGICSYGTARDWLIGIGVVNAEGKIVRGGGKVVKNVTGYDIPKMHIGALGNLGVIVEATFKVAPRPERSRGLLFTTAPPNFLTQLHERTLPLMSRLRTMTDRTIFAVIYAGSEEVVNEQIEQARGLAAQHGAETGTLPDGVSLPFADSLPDAAVIVRFVSDRASAVALHQTVTEMPFWSQVDTLPTPGLTDAYLANHVDAATTLEKVIHCAENTSARITVLHAPIAQRGPDAQLWTPIPSSFPLMKRLKDTLDPKTILNPGRFLGGL